MRRWLNGNRRARRMSRQRCSSGWHGAGCRQRLGDGAGVALPRTHFGPQLRATGAGELVVLRATVVLGVAPLAGDPVVLLEAMEGGVEGALFDKQLAVGDALDPLGDGVAVPRAPREGLEDQHIERAAEESAFRVEHPAPLSFRGEGMHVRL